MAVTSSHRRTCLVNDQQATRTGGQLVVDGLRRWEVDVMFAIPGVQLDWLFDALAEDGTIRVVHTRHEQGAAYMADGYARATGRVGVCAVVPGPGVLNALAALCTAYAANSPVLCITGHVFGGDAAAGFGVLHELPDQSAAIRAVIGRSTRVRNADDIPALIDETFVGLTRPGRRRPAALEIGPEILAAKSTATYASRPVLPAALRPHSDLVAAAVAALAGCVRPMIWAGGGAIGAGDSIAALADALDAPITLTYGGRGAVSDRNPRVLPPSGGFALARHADAIIVVGSRMQGTVGPVAVADGCRVVRVDVDPEQLARTPAGALLIEADAAAACTELAAALHTSGVARERSSVQASAITMQRAAIADGLAQGWPESAAMCGALRSAMPDDGILVDDMTQVGYFARNGFPVYEPRTYIGSGYQGTLGSGFATALGAKIGMPDRPVVSISGDGGFLFTAAELATAAQHGIAAVAVVFDDEAYGNVKGIQQRGFGREIASSLRNPDFVALAASFGISGVKVSDAEGLRSALSEAIATDRPALIHVPIGPQPDMWAVLGGRRTFG